MNSQTPARSVASVKKPTISVIIANYGGAAHIRQALQSVLSQTVDSLEIIVSDDGSRDRSVDIVKEMMATDDRIRLIVAERNGGPASVRNRGLEAAQGEWIAVVDSDDIIHPERFERLLVAASAGDADGVADDLLFFADDGSAAPSTLLEKAGPAGPMLLSVEHFIRSNTPGTGLPALGYIKPLLRRSKLSGQRYDEALRIGEDYDFLLRYLLRGGTFLIVPEPLYLYRRYAGSISHRLSETAVVAMMDCQAQFERSQGPFATEIDDLLRKRMAALLAVAAFERLVGTIKDRRLEKAGAMILHNPGLVAPLLRSLIDHVSRKLRRSAASKPSSDYVVLSDRQLSPQLENAINQSFPVEGGWRFIRVGAYSAPVSRQQFDCNMREDWLMLAALAKSSRLDVIACGASGWHAASFIPTKRLVGVVGCERSDAQWARSVFARSDVPLLVTDEVADEVRNLPRHARRLNGHTLYYPDVVPA